VICSGICRFRREIPSHPSGQCRKKDPHPEYQASKDKSQPRRRTKVVGAFPEENWALVLVATRLRRLSFTSWGLRNHMNMKLLDMRDKQAVSAAWESGA
jgi:hypothetical protein